MKALQPLIEKYKVIEKKTNAMSMRERLIMCSMAVSIFWIGMLAFFLEPLYIQANDKNKEIAELILKIEEESTKKTILGLEYSVDPNVANKKRIQELEYQIQRVEQNIQSKTKSLIPTDKTVFVLQDILKAQDALYLISLDKLDPISVAVIDEEDDKKPTNLKKELTKSVINNVTSGLDDEASQTLNLALNKMLDTTDPILSQQKEVSKVYRHGVKITFSGEYKDVLDYLVALETLEWKVYWKSFNYKIDNYPKGTAEVVVETIGFDNGWMGV